MADVAGALRQTVKRFVPPPVRQKIRHQLFQASERFHHATREKWHRPVRSYSQFGEDVIAQHYFKSRNTKSGFYVDVGAHSPKFFSNTYHFYKRGWRGINIEPTPGRVEMFRRMRPRDINLALAISDRDEELTFFTFKAEGLMNTADPRQAEIYATELRETPKPMKVKARPLRDVLAEHLAPSSKIDLMSVDVEGFDAAVLRSNDWTAFRPELLLVECLASDIDEIQQSETAEILAGAAYRMYAWAPKTVFFVPKD